MRLRTLLGFMRLPALVANTKASGFASVGFTWSSTSRSAPRTFTRRTPASVFESSTSDGRLNAARTKPTGNLLFDVCGEDAHLELGD